MLAPVLVLDQDERVTGLFTDGDLRRLVIDDPAGLNRPIGEVMTSNPLTIQHTATVGEARTLVAEHRIDEIPVVDQDGRAVGIIGRPGSPLLLAWRWTDLMSIVVALRQQNRITMAADTLAVFGEGMAIDESNARAVKILPIGDAILGGTGWAVYDDILDHFLTNAQPPRLHNRRDIYAFFLEFWKALRETYSLVNEQAATKETPFGDLDATFLLASPGGLFKISSDMGVTEFHQYHAIGSGSEYAIGRPARTYSRRVQIKR